MEGWDLGPQGELQVCAGEQAGMNTAMTTSSGSSAGVMLKVKLLQVTTSPGGCPEVSLEKLLGDVLALVRTGEETGSCHIPG